MEANTARSESYGRIHGRLDELNGDVGKVANEVAQLRGEVSTMGRNITLIHEHLLNQK